MSRRTVPIATRGGRIRMVNLAMPRVMSLCCDRCKATSTTSCDLWQPFEVAVRRLNQEVLGAGWRYDPTMNKNYCGGCVSVGTLAEYLTTA